MKLEMRSENAVRQTDVETIPSKASLRDMVNYVDDHFNLNKSPEEKKNSRFVYVN